MNSTPSHRRSLVILNLVAVLALTGAGVAAATDALVSPNGVELRPYRGYESAALRVTGPDGLVIEQVFEGSTSIWLPLLDDAGSALPDGQYTWSLTLTPALSPKVKEQLRQARENGDESIVLELRASGALPDPADMVSSGSLKVTGGAFVVPSTDVEEQVRATGESAAKGGADDQDVPTRDQVIADDLIVTGSACVGFDCVNGESFGFDTIRLKENNLRIKFDDTSASAGFPNVDWQLTANDSASGGANKFSIDDITSGRTPFTIEASAPSNSLYVDDGGRVGFGTATPSVELHVVNGDSPTLRLEQNGSSGFTPQTWDIAGNEANFFVRDVTNGSALPFRIQPGADSNSLYIKSDNNVGIGTASPDADLDIEAAGPSLRFSNTGSFGGHWSLIVDPDSGRLNWEDPAGQRPVKLEQNAANNLLRIGIPSTDTVEVNGVLSVNGSVKVDGTTVHADFVFDPGYDLPTIPGQGEFMLAHRHLPSLPAAPDGLRGPVDLVSHQMGILEELEKAHLYILQLHQRLAELEEQVEALQGDDSSK